MNNVAGTPTAFCNIVLKATVNTTVGYEPDIKMFSNRAILFSTYYMFRSIKIILRWILLITYIVTESVA
jgi:hypothetical protein